MGRVSDNALRWLIIWLMPAIMLAVFARQAYLHQFAQLSTWKGGGMGMFAAADGLINRFTKVYIVSPQHGRQPLIRLTIPQKRLMESALWYPVRESFQPLADSVFATSWSADDQPIPISFVDADGKQTGKAAQAHYMLYPFGVRPSAEKPDWGLEIEYWSMSYDPATRRIRADHIITHRFGAPS